MKITFLGTGTSQGVPVIACQCKTCQSKNSKDKRLRSSVLIQDGNTNIMIDAGPDFRYQVLRSGITTLDGILITHGHKDHVGGLDDVRSFNFLQKKAMNVYAGNFAFPDLKREFHYAFNKDRYPGSPRINLVEVNEKAQAQGRVKSAVDLAQQRGFVDWIDVDVKKFSGVFKTRPERAELPQDINEHLIVELYSK